MLAVVGSARSARVRPRARRHADRQPRRPQAHLRHPSRAVRASICVVERLPSGRDRRVPRQTASAPSKAKVRFPWRAGHRRRRRSPQGRRRYRETQPARRGCAMYQPVSRGVVVQQTRGFTAGESRNRCCEFAVAGRRGGVLVGDRSDPGLGHRQANSAASVTIFPARRCRGRFHRRSDGGARLRDRPA